MTLEDLRTPKGMLPWWPWLLYFALMLGGLGVALGVYSRQSGHIRDNRATAEEIRAVEDKVERIGADLTTIKGYVDELDAIQEINARRLRTVEVEAGVEAGAEGERNEALKDRHEAEDETP